MCELSHTTEVRVVSGGIKDRTEARVLKNTTEARVVFSEIDRGASRLMTLIINWN